MTACQRRPGWARGLSYAATIVAFAGVSAACSQPAVLTQLVDAQARTSALHLALTRSIDARNRATMATEDALAADAANESRDAVAAIDRQLPELQRVLEELTYQIELKRLDGFKARFEEYRRLNDDILSLVLENTNVKAQRLAFGPAADAARPWTASCPFTPRSWTCRAATATFARWRSRSAASGPWPPKPSRS